ncbi:hypothetical protein BJF79_15140 [Actinomadura sp. CNU-125]|uniref:DUF6518 family protein n=1 Tax=Actinomadura sp. CNU-125 TaxID=1904961 RepID=UPI00095CFABC|nr:DUF6518 family protein [Actinomadura sp. CNU-125]OLT22097.1 hypothetical protein BJF79_15140 [Actinomadura sp. CNU-125]
MIKVLVAVAIGVVFGAATSTMNALSSPYTAVGEPLAGTAVAPVLQVVSRLLGVGWSWAALAVAVGWYACRPVPGALAGTAALVAATAAYYVLDPVFRGEPFGMHASSLVFWAVAGAVAGPALGALGSRVGRPGPLGLLAGLAVPAGAALEMLVFRGPSPLVPLSAAEQVARWLVLAAAAAVAVAVLVRRPARLRPDGPRDVRRRGRGGVRPT